MEGIVNHYAAKKCNILQAFAYTFQIFPGIIPPDTRRRGDKSAVLVTIFCGAFLIANNNHCGLVLQKSSIKHVVDCYV